MHCRTTCATGRRKWCRFGHRVMSPLLIDMYPPYPEMGTNREECAAHTANYYRRLSWRGQRSLTRWRGSTFRSYLDERGLLVVRQDPSPAP